MNITDTIKSNLDKMTKSEYAVATYFLQNPNDFAFETLDSIASLIKTSTTSVLRFCRKNGFQGYKSFQDEVRLNLSTQMTLPDKFKIASETTEKNSQLFKPAYNALSCIEQTFASLSASLVSDAADLIINAKRVFCFGLKESFSLSHYAYTRFLTLRNDVFILSAGNIGEIEPLLSIGKGDVCIFYLFHRYTKQSPQMLRCIKDTGADIILITAPPYDEIEKNATILLPCHVDIHGIKNSSAAPVCLTDCLCNAVVSKSGSSTLEYMKKTEMLFKNFALLE